MTLVKAKLKSDDGGGEINFMFNPSHITIKNSSDIRPRPGARTAKGLPKMTFAYPEPKVITINDIRFDTYETGKSVMPYLQSFEKALNFVSEEKRPPTYVFSWGSQQYIRCFIKELSYDLTMFLPDGTPVRAVIKSLTLTEIDESISAGSTTTPQPTEEEREEGGRE